MTRTCRDFLDEFHGGLEGEIFGEGGHVGAEGFLAVGDGGGDFAGVGEGGGGGEGLGGFAEGGLFVEELLELGAEFVPELADLAAAAAVSLKLMVKIWPGGGLRGEGGIEGGEVAVVGGDEAVAEGVAEFVVGGGEVEEVGDGGGEGGFSVFVWRDGPRFDGVEIFVVVFGELEGDLREAVVVGGLGGELELLAGHGVGVFGWAGDGDGGGRRRVRRRG